MKKHNKRPQKARKPAQARKSRAGKAKAPANPKNPLTQLMGRIKALAAGTPGKPKPKPLSPENAMHRARQAWARSTLKRRRVVHVSKTFHTHPTDPTIVMWGPGNTYQPGNTKYKRETRAMREALTKGIAK